MTDAMHSAQLEVPIDAEPVLSVRGATKTFGAVVALDGVDLEVRSGEVLALLGDNGAGKSTLIKCISGVYKLDRGEIRIDGALVQISRRRMPDRMGSRPSTKTWPCSTTSTRRRTSSPDARWPTLPGFLGGCSG